MTKLAIFTAAAAAMLATACGDSDAAPADAARDAPIRDAGSADAQPGMDAPASDGTVADDGSAGDAWMLDATQDDAIVLDDAAGDAETDASVAMGDGGTLLTDVRISHPASSPIPPATECTVLEATAVSPTAGHVLDCDPVSYETEPPCYGLHYGTPADFRTYDAPVPWGFLVHSLEHGGVVIAYACASPDACPAIAAALQSIVDARPMDPRCVGTPLRNRMILVPDPTLSVPIAAAMWGHLYRATCIDATSLHAFIDRYYGTAPEDFCWPGADLSATGWCAADAGVTP